MAWVNTRPAAVLAKDTLQEGDILIHHAHLGANWEKRAFHCSIVGPVADGFAQVYDSLPHQGVRKKPTMMITDQCVVFRPITDAGTQGIEVAAGTRAARMLAAGTGYSDALMGVGRAVGSVFASHNFDRGAQTRLMKYVARDNGSPKNVFCSEYVILCYQMACWDMGLFQGAAHFPNRDAKYTTPWDLEAYLLKHNTAWQLVGAV